MKRLLIFCALFAACDSRTSALIEIDGPMPLGRLDFDATLPGHHVAQSLVTSGSLKLPATVILLLPDVATTVQVVMTGTEAGGREVGASTGFASIPHSQVKLTMTLTGPGDDLAMPEDLAGADLTGFVEDLAGADLTGFVEDLAGADLGALPRLSLLAGLPGGNATFDGTGKDARLAVPTMPVLIGTTLYVAEIFSGILRMVDVTNGVVTTAQLLDSVSSMPTTLNGPVGLVSDGQGHLYVSNAFDYTIRKINLADMKVSLIAGASGVQGSTDSPPRFKQPAALLYENGNLWVSDEVDCTVRKIDLSGPTVFTVAGTPGNCHSDDGAGAAGHFVRPRGLTLYNGDIYVADEGSLRKLTPTPSPSPAPLSTVVPNGTWVGTSGVASAGGGVFYVVDEAYNTVHRLTLPNTNELIAGSDGYPQDFVDGVGGAARFADPRWIILDGAGAAYISEGAAIRKMDLTSFNVSTLAGMSAQSDRTDSPRARFAQPSAVVFDGADTLYVAEYANNDIRKVSLSTGNTTTLAGNGDYKSLDGIGTAASLYSPLGLALDGSGNLFVSDSQSSCIRKIAIASAEVKTIAGSCGTGAQPSPSPVPGASATFQYPSALAWDGDHTLFVADAGNNALRTIDLSNTNYMVSWVVGSTSSGSTNGIGRAADLSNPHGLAWDGAHKLLYVADNGSGLVRKIDFTNPAMPQVTRLSGTPYPTFIQDGPLLNATYGQVGNMVLDNGVLWVADNTGHLIRRLDLGTGMVTSPIGKKGFQLTKPGPLPAFVHSPWGVAMTPRGLVLTSWEENCVLLATGLQ